MSWPTKVIATVVAKGHNIAKVNKTLSTGDEYEREDAQQGEGSHKIENERDGKRNVKKTNLRKGE